MDIRIQKIIEGLFCLEDLREVYRGALPTGLAPEEEVVFGAKFDELERIVAEIRTGTGQPKVDEASRARSSSAPREEAAINIQPIQAAGRLTPRGEEGRDRSTGDGYSTCDACRKPFRLDKICKPPIASFHEELAAFVGMDQARVVPGARRGFQAVASSLVQKGDPVIVSALAPLHRVPRGRAGRRARPRGAASTRGTSSRPTRRPRRSRRCAARPGRRRRS